MNELNGVSGTVAKHNVVVIAGESGSGKSSLVSQLVAGVGVFKRVLWLTAEQLSKSNQGEIAHVFELRHSIPELIRNSTLRGCVLITDGFEKLEGDARKRALELIAAVKDEGFSSWKLIITYQTQSWESVQDALIAAASQTCSMKLLNLRGV